MDSLSLISSPTSELFEDSQAFSVGEGNKGTGLPYGRTRALVPSWACRVSPSLTERLWHKGLWRASGRKGKTEVQPGSGCWVIGPGISFSTFSQFLVTKGGTGDLGAAHREISEDTEERLGSPGGSGVRSPLANAGDTSSIPGGGNGHPLQYCHLENSTDRGVWWAKIHGVATSRTRLSDWAHTQRRDQVSEREETKAEVDKHTKKLSKEGAGSKTGLLKIWTPVS